MFATTTAADASGVFLGFAMDHADTSGTVSGAGIAEFTARLRRATRDLVADAANRDDRTAIADATRPIVAAVRNELRDWRHEGASGPQVAAAWVRMVDTAVREAYHMARFQSGQTGMVAPLAVVAVGAYGGQVCARTAQSSCCSSSPPTGASFPAVGWRVA